MIKSISLAHGSGKGLETLLSECVLPALGIHGGVLEDAAIIPAPSGQRLAFTTDSFVVDPLEFPGGNIGKLAACGSINDLAVMGAIPHSLSVALILEEGLDTALLERVLTSLRSVCDECGVAIVCGDTKVVGRGKGDGIFINTSGIGFLPDGLNFSAANAQVGDRVFVSRSIGCHGIAILAQRQNLGFASSVQSDCAPLHALCKSAAEVPEQIRLLRDATRGGCAAVLNEIAKASKVSIKLDETAIPIDPEVQSACNYLGMDPLQIANEGTFVGIIKAETADAVLQRLHSVPGGEQATIIGTVIEPLRFPVITSTQIGGTRPVEVPAGELLPRIC